MSETSVQFTGFENHPLELADRYPNRTEGRISAADEETPEETPDIITGEYDAVALDGGFRIIKLARSDQTDI